MVDRVLEAKQKDTMKNLLDEAIFTAIQPALDRADHLIQEIQLAQLEDVLEVPAGRHAR